MVPAAFLFRHAARIAIGMNKPTQQPPPQGFILLGEEMTLPPVTRMTPMMMHALLRPRRRAADLEVVEVVADKEKARR